MESQIKKGRGKPRKTKRETIRKYSEVNELDSIWFRIEHYGVIWSM
jgi:hypothetical protein